MFKVTITPPSYNKFSKEFDVNQVIIGSGLSEDFDLLIPESPIEGPLLKITLQNNKYYLTKLSPDSNISLNGVSFEKEHLLEDGDLIEIYSIALIFEHIQINKEQKELLNIIDQQVTPTLSNEEKLLNDSKSLLSKIDSLIENEALLPSNQEPSEIEDADSLVEKTNDALQVSSIYDPFLPNKEESQFLFDIEELIKEAEGIDINLLIDQNDPQKKKESQELDTYGLIFADENADLKISTSLKIQSSQVLDKENLTEETTQLSQHTKKTLIHTIFDGVDFEKNPLSKYSEEKLGKGYQTSSKKIIARYIAGISCIILLIFIVSAFTYHNHLTNKHQQTELNAARALADTTMSLLYKKLLTPSDTTPTITPDSLQESYNQIIPLHYRTINSKKLLSPENYTIQLYNDSKLQKFLLIAQPKNNLANTLVPQSTFIISNQDLTVRVTNTPQSWQSLLSENSDFEKISQTKIQTLLLDTVLVKLSSLEPLKKNLGFTPPSQIEIINPEATNYIYNAPRYYSFGTPLLNKSEELFKQKKFLTPVEKAELIYQLKTISDRYDTYDTLILYSDEGITQALENYYTMTTTLPNSHYLFGTISFNNTTGWIDHSSLLNKKELILFAQQNTLPSPHKIESKEKIELTSNLEQLSNSPYTTSNQKDIQEKISNLIKKKQNDLSEVLNEINLLIKTNNKNPIPNFISQKQKLSNSYNKINAIHNKLIKAGLDLIYAEYQTNSPETNIPYLFQIIHTRKLENYMSDQLKQKEKKEFTYIITEEKLKTLIEKTTSLHHLNKILEHLNILLIPQKIPNPIKFISLKRYIREKTIEQLNTIILSAPSLANTFITLQNQEQINQILKNAQISETEIQKFYLNQFNQLMKKFHMPPSIKQIQDLQKINKSLLTLTSTNNTTSSKEISLKQINKIEELETQKELITTRNQHIVNIPLNIPYTLKEKENYTEKLAQQIIVQATLETPNLYRNQQLFEAIYLLEQGTEHNRLIWGDILQAYKLLTELPQQKIKKLLQLDTGFNLNTTPSYIKIKDMLESYLTNKQHLLTVNNEKDLNSHYNYFIQTQLPILKKIKQLAKKILSSSITFKKASYDYSSSLQMFLENYKKAQKQGFFIINPNYQHQQLATLQKKFSLIQEALPKINQFANALIKLSSGYIHLIQEEENKITTNNSINESSSEYFLQQWQQYTYPKQSNFNINDFYEFLFSIQVFPLS